MNILKRIQSLRPAIQGVLALGGILFVIVLVLVVIVRTSYREDITDVAHAGKRTYGVVLGASIDPGAMKPSPLLQDRLDTAIDLLRERKIQGVAVTGDDGSWKSDERTVMVSYLKEHNVPDEIIFVDKPAFRTYDSCKNLVEQGFTNVILITQNFHLPRALYLCNELGMKAIGVSADKHWYARFVYDWFRDFAASPFAFFDVKGLVLIKKGPSL